MGRTLLIAPPRGCQDKWEVREVWLAFEVHDKIKAGVARFVSILQMHHSKVHALAMELEHLPRLTGIGSQEHGNALPAANAGRPDGVNIKIMLD
jgi:hypothetical protein